MKTYTVTYVTRTREIAKLNVRASGCREAFHQAKRHISPEFFVIAAQIGETSGVPCSYKPFYGKAP